MGNCILDKIVDEIWGKKSSVFVMLSIVIIFGAVLSSSIYSQMSFSDNTNNPECVLTRTGIFLLSVMWISLLALFVWYLIFVFNRNHIRGAKKGCIGIIIYYDCESKCIYKNTVRRLGEEFRAKIQDNFDIIDVPYGIERTKVNNKEKIVDFLMKRRSILLINIMVNSNEEEKLVNYDMRIEGAIIHPTYRDSVEKEFQKAFTQVVNNFRDTVFSSKEMTRSMRLTAKEMSIGCEYIIGLSYFLNGQLYLSEHICDNLAEKLKANENMSQMLVSVNRIRYGINMYLATVHLDKYQFSCNEDDELRKMNEYLEKANTCFRNTPEYCINKAYYYIAYEDNVSKATELINICKQKKGAPLVWRYSDAFLKAYSNRSIGSIWAAYKSALKIPYNTLDLTVYIEKMAETRPEKVGLYLALGILYKVNDDSQLASECFEKYISCSKDSNNVRDVLHKKGLYYNGESC